MKKHFLFKLSSGDDVIGNVLSDDDKGFLVQDAMIVRLHDIRAGVSIQVVKYAPFAEDDLVLINKDNVITSMVVSKPMSLYYEKCVRSYKECIDKQFEEQMKSVDNEVEIKDTKQSAAPTVLDDDWLKDYFKTRVSGNTSIH
jgi:hypothetical protein